MKKIVIFGGIAVIAIVLIVVFSVRSTSSDEFCYKRDGSTPENSFNGVKTSYKFVSGEIGSSHVFPSCKPQKIISISRHGTRLPSSSDIRTMMRLTAIRESILENVKAGRGTLCAEDVAALEAWTIHPSAKYENANELMPQGWKEIGRNAKNLQKLFPELLPSEYTKEHYHFRYSKTQRTEDSCRSYITSLFGNDSVSSVFVTPPIEDDPMLFFNCGNKTQDVVDLYLPGSPMYDFLQSDGMAKMYQEISDRLGFETPIDWHTLQSLMVGCQFEMAWNPDLPSTWCSAFTPHQRLMIEYMDEISIVQLFGYNNKYYQTAPCHIIQDLLNRLADNSNPKAIIYFTHDYMINMILIAANFGQIGNITEYAVESIPEREWTVGRRLPFAANLVAVQYNCTNEDQANVAFFLNERPIALEGCDGHLCSYSKLVKIFQKYITQDCDTIHCRGGDL